MTVRIPFTATRRSEHGRHRKPRGALRRRVALMAVAATTIALGVAAPASGAAPVASDQSVSTGEGHQAFFGLSWSGSGSPAVTIVTPPAHGSLAAPDSNDQCFTGSCLYTPAAGYVGTDTFRWSVNDGFGTSNTATVTVTVTANTPPTAADVDAGTLTAGLATPVYLSIYDAEDLGVYYPYTQYHVTRTIVTGPAHGSATCDPDPNLYYACTVTPASSYTGSDSFTYRVTDSNGATSTVATVSWTAAANVAPVLGDVTMDADANSPTFVPFVASDANNDPLVLSVLTPPAHGHFLSDTCSLGYCYYVGDLGYDGPDSFTARVNDGQANSPAATVSITVHGNVAPQADDGLYYAREHKVTALNLYAYDANGDVPAYTVVTSPTHGSLSCGLDGSCTYTGDSGFTGDDSFTWKANDGKVDSRTATATVTVYANTPPQAFDVQQTVPSSQSSTVFLSWTDADLDPVTSTIVASPAHGTLNGCSAGACTFTPNTGYVGTDTFTYRVSDDLAASNTATATLTVQAVNHAPTAVDHTWTTRESRPVSFLLDAADPDGDPLTSTVVSGPAHGTLTGCTTIGAGCTYTPATGFVGADSFTWRASDGTLSSNTATLSLTVTANRAPAAVAGTVGPAANGVPLDLTLVASDPDGDPLTSVVVTQPAHGAVSCPGGSLSCTYLSTDGFIGNDTFTFRVVDDLGATSTTVTETVKVGVNTAPTAHDQTATTRESRAVGLDLDATDPNTAQTLSYTVVSGPSHGTLTSCASGLCTYTPDSGFVGTDSFTWRANDGLDDSGTATVTVTVTADRAPVAQNLVLNGATAGSASTVSLVGSDPDGDPLTSLVVGQPLHGTLSCPGGSLTCSYTATVGYTGPDSFTYRVVDDLGLQSNLATGTISVRNLPPTANAGPDTTVTEGAGATLTGAGTDPDSPALAYTWTYAAGSGVDAGAACSFGSATSSTTSFTCTDDGTYTVTLRVDDGVNTPATDTATVTVTNVAPSVSITAPVTGSTTTVGDPLTVTATYGDAGANDTQTCSVAWGDGSTSTGSLAGGACSATHTYAAAAEGGRTIAVSVSDDDGGVGTDTRSVVVVPVPNQPPTADAGPDRTGTEGAPVSLDGTGTDSDSPTLTYAWTWTAASGVDAGTTCSFGNPTSADTSFTCTDDGTFTVRLAVNDGVNPPVTDTATVTVANAAPTATQTAPVAGSSHDVDTPVDLAVEVADAGSNDTHACTVDWGDGASTPGTVTTGVCRASHTYTEAGSRTIVTRVEDDDSGTTSTSVTITVTAVLDPYPTADAGPDAAGTEGMTVQLSGSGSDPLGQALTYSWAWAPGAGVDVGTTCSFGDPTAAATSFRCDDDGAFTVTLSVSDGAARTPVTDSATVTLSNSDPVVRVDVPTGGTSVAAGDPVLVSATVTDAGAHDTQSCTVDWGDDVVSAGTFVKGVCSATHTYAASAAGTRTITVQATDDDAGTGSDSVVTVTVNLLPTADAGADRTGTEGATVTLNGSGSDPEHAALTYQWSYSAGSGVDAGTTCSFGSPKAASTSFRCDDDGTFTVTLTVDDGVNPPVADSATVTLANADPTAHVTAPAAGASVTTGTPVTLSATVSDAGTHDTLSCTIDWGDGTTAAGTLAAGTCTGTHTYAASDAGTRTVSVRVADDDGGVATDAVAITVAVPVNSVPRADAGPDRTGTEGATVTLNGSGSDPESAPLAYQWTYAAGSGVDAGTTCSFGSPKAPSTSFRCDDDGTFTVTLTVDDGVNPPVADSATVTLANADPTAHVNAPAAGASVTTGTPVALSATVGDAGTHDTLSCTIDWGDGTTGNGDLSGSTCSASHSYATGGGRTIVVRVADDDGGAGTDSVTVTVADAANRPPTVDAGPDVPGTEGIALRLRGHGSDPEGGALTYRWTYRAGADVDPGATCRFGSGASPSTSFRCTDDGTFTVTLTVSDGVNTPVSDTSTVALRNAPPEVTILRPWSGTSVDAGSTVRVVAKVTDLGANDTATCTFAWGDGTSSQAMVADHRCTAEHVWTRTGSRVITVTARDDDGGRDTASVQLCVHTPPRAQGHGTLDSPAGGASFDFDVSRPAGTPGGGTLNAADPSGTLVATTVEGLAFDGATATWRGVATWKGAAGYRYWVVATDGRCRWSAATGTDTVTITVRDTAGLLVWKVGGALRSGDVVVG